jgi:hypothetical protein
MFGLVTRCHIPCYGFKGNVSLHVVPHHNYPYPMKHFILFFLLLLTAAPLYGQQENILTGLHPRPKTSFFRPGQNSFTINAATKVVISDAPSIGTLRAVQYLERILHTRLGDTLTVVHAAGYSGNSNAIFIGEPQTFAGLLSQLSKVIPLGETTPRAEGYILDVSSSGLLLAGSDTSGTFYSVSTLAQLISQTGLTIPALHILDYPDFPVRWVFSQHNLQVLAQVQALEQIEDSMAYHKLNGLQQNDFKYNILGKVPSWYFTDVDSLHAHSWLTNVEIIPGVCNIGYSDGVLYNDPDLAEGIPTTCSYLIQNDTGKLLTDPRVTLPNGGFENVSNGQFTGWSWYDNPGTSIFVDSTISHTGRRSARCTNLTGVNTRFERTMPCSPFHGYHLSVWAKTQSYSGLFQLLALGHHGDSNRTLTFTQYPVQSTTTGWHKFDVVFNTLTFDTVYLYCGSWGGSGTIWFDDFSVEDAGTTNLLRRPSEMPVVTVAGKSNSYKEGIDYAKISDDTMYKYPGSYTWHTSPKFRVLPGSSIVNGDTVLIHFIRANPVINDTSGDGSTMVCISEDTLYSILHDQISRVEALHHPNRYFMTHDEIREMNWDTACSERHLSPADLLADNLKKCDSIIREVHPNAERLVWSDMFDSLHNAHDGYYLVNGNLTGDWNKIPNDITIANWNSGYMKASLNFFALHGFSQITSTYFDTRSTNNIRNWRVAVNNIPNVRGTLYTTWTSGGDYSYLTPFADYAWGAGPMIVHTPLDSITAAIDMVTVDSIRISADIFADEYNPSDSIVTATLTSHYSNGTEIVQLGHSGSHYSGYLHHIPDRGYSIAAYSAEPLTGTTPTYIVPTAASNDVASIPEANTIPFLYPNPANDHITVTPPFNSLGAWHIEIVNALGIIVRNESIPGPSSDGTVSISTGELPIGTYTCVIKEGHYVKTEKLVILR